jgi:hypothetical protein
MRNIVRNQNNDQALRERRLNIISSLGVVAGSFLASYYVASSENYIIKSTFSISWMTSSMIASNLVVFLAESSTGYILPREDFVRARKFGVAAGLFCSNSLQQNYDSYVERLHKKGLIIKEENNNTPLFRM